MKPSSSSSETPGGLFSGILERGGVRALTTDAAWLAAMVEAEVGLARASARLELISTADAEAIATACAAEPFDAAAIGHDAAATGTPIVPLLERIRSRLTASAAEAVHRGATSQDIVDTATMLIAHRALGVILEDLDGAADAAAGLADRHRHTTMVARTLLQQAVPTTFGLKAAGWLSGLDRASDGLRLVRRTCLASQLGGAAGTLAGFGDRGREVVVAFAGEIGLPAAAIPWHTDRTRIGQLAAALGVAAGAVAKPARDIVLLAQSEVAEVSEGVAGRGGSSSMAHKHNAIGSVSALAAAQRAPGLVSTILGAMVHEHERAAGAWHAEWLPLRDLLVSAGSAAAWLRDGLEHLTVDAARMGVNLAATSQDAADLGSAVALVDEALASHQAARDGR